MDNLGVVKGTNDVGGVGKEYDVLEGKDRSNRE
jgi:hypothetical protein